MENCSKKKRGRRPKEQQSRTCPHCQRAFIQRRPSGHQIHCSKSCFYASRKKDVRTSSLPCETHCVICCAPISLPKRRFCSKRCSKVHERKMDKILGRKRPSGKKKERKVFQSKPCRICSNHFNPKNDANIYCSSTCFNRSTRRKTRLRERGRPQPIHLRVKKRLSGRLRELLNRKGLQKQNAINSYTGCSPKEMVTHIQQQVTDGMNWENYGVFGWHLDHIIPCSRFDLSKEEHCSVCFNWRNIRPLWGEKNYMRQDMLSLDEALQLDPELVRMANEAGVRLW